MRITLHLLFSLLNWIVKNAITNVNLHFFLIRKCKLVFLNPPVCSRGLRASLCFNIWWMWLQSAWLLSHDSFCGKWAWAVRSLPAPDYVSYPRLLPCFTEYELNCVKRGEDRPHFLIKRCPVGSHANFTKLNQCAIWDYPSASHARLFEMFLSALYGSCSKGRSRCPLPMCSQFVTTPLVHYLIKIDFSDVSFFIPLSQWQSLLSLNVDTGEKIQKLDPGPEIG